MAKPMKNGFEVFWVKKQATIEKATIEKATVQKVVVSRTDTQNLVGLRKQVMASAI